MFPDLSIEAAFEGIVAGVDEAGRGPWAGPVVAAAVILDRGKIPPGINDSKKLKGHKREELFSAIISCSQTAIGIASVEEIDSLNILGATKLAMQRAVEMLPIAPNVALIDGNQPPKLSCRVQSIIGGDAKSLSIAAASILAKVTRDRIMCDLAKQFPHYGWESNAGYGTQKHQDGLKTYGVCAHHRKSFAPIREILNATVAA